MKLAHRPHGDSILNDSVTNHPDVAAALELLKPYQATFVEAARFYIKNSNLIRDSGKLRIFKAELLQSKGLNTHWAQAAEKEEAVWIISGSPRSGGPM